MNKTVINVNYPTTIDVVIKSKAEALSMGYKNAIIRHLPVNRPYRVAVKQVKRLVQEEFMTSKDFDNELEAMSKEQTGLGRFDFQARHGKAWNE